MNQKTTAKKKRNSQLKNAVVTSIADFILIVTNIGLIIMRQQRQKPFNMETYNPFLNKLKIILLFISLIVLLIILIYSAIVNENTEKDDELSRLHKYKAGNLGKTITLLLFALMVFFIKDFSFAFTGDFIDGLSLPIIIVITGELITNVTFIILEKFQLD